MKKFITIFIFFGIAVLSAISSESVSQVINRMKTNNLSSAFGSNDKEGDFFIVRDITSVSTKMNPNQAEELARIQAKKRIAAFLGQNIQSNEESSYLEKTVSVDGKEKNAMVETFKSFQRTDINQLLKGAKEISLQKDGNIITCVYLISSRTKNIASDLSNNESDYNLKSNDAKYNKNDPTVTAIGVAVIVNDRIDEAKKLALSRAMQNAIEQVLGTMLASTTQIQDLEKVKSKIFTNSIGFIDNYRINEEGVSGKSYKIDGMFKVSKNKLYDSYKSLLETMGDPYFYIEAGNDFELADKFSEFFKDLGFKITDRKSSAAYIIELKGRFARLKHPVNRRDGTQLSLWIKMFNPVTGKLLFTIKNDPRKAAVFYGNKERQHDLTIKKAFTQVESPLHEKINSAVVQMVQTGREITVNIENYSSVYKRFNKKIEEAIKAVPGVSDINTEIDSNSRVLKFIVTYSGKIDPFAEFMNSELQKSMPKNYIPKIQNQSSNNLTYTF